VGAKVPDTWDEVFELAAIRPGFVTLPLMPVDALMSFFSICANADEAPFSRTNGTIVSRGTGEKSLRILQRLARTALPEAMNWNPIKLWEHMSQTDDVGYCPFGFGYSNYSRNGYRRSLLKFGNVPSAGFGPIGAILGGAGLAISSKCKAKEIAVAYAQWVSGAECQKKVYFSSGGQPGNRKAWTDAEVNREASNFFIDTLATLSQAFLRPRVENFVAFQAEASFIVSDFLKEKYTTLETLGLMDECYEKNCVAA
jgi:multiple sugar transport system substrate-binding protein